ncbi:MAG: triacylglycerol lipase, partial [Halobacteria archaeon]
MRAVALGVLVLVALSATALAERDPVVFVHGYLGGGWNFFAMKERLEADGWNSSRLHAISYSNPVGSNVQNANELKAFVEDVLARTGAARVDMVVHSMGGLSSRYYIKNLGGDAKVDTLITLGSPHHGTWAALAGALTTGAREMIPGNSFLSTLNSGDESWGAVKYVSIRSNVDEVMIPKSSPILDGAENIEVKWIGHLGLLLDSGVYQTVKARLDFPETLPPGPSPPPSPGPAPAPSPDSTVEADPLPCVTSTGSIAFETSPLSAPSLLGQPLSQVPQLQVGGGVLVTATNGSLNSSLWCVNMTAVGATVAAVGGELLPGVQAAAVDGAVAFTVSDPSVVVTVQSGNVTYSLSANGSGVEVSASGEPVATVALPDGAATAGGQALKSAFRIALPRTVVNATSTLSTVGLRWSSVAGAAVYEVQKLVSKSAPWASLGNLTATSLDDPQEAGMAIFRIQPRDAAGLPIAAPSVVSKTTRTFTYQPGKTNLFWVSIPHGSKFARASDIVAALEPEGGNSKVS